MSAGGQHHPLRHAPCLTLCTLACRVLDLQGCGANGVNDLNRIHFRNDGYGGGGDKYLCLSNIRLL